MAARTGTDRGQTRSSPRPPVVRNTRHPQKAGPGTLRCLCPQLTRRGRGAVAGTRERDCGGRTDTAGKARACAMPTGAFTARSRSFRPSIPRHARLETLPHPAWPPFARPLPAIAPPASAALQREYHATPGTGNKTSTVGKAQAQKNPPGEPGGLIVGTMRHGAARTRSA